MRLIGDSGLKGMHVSEKIRFRICPIKRPLRSPLSQLSRARVRDSCDETPIKVL